MNQEELNELSIQELRSLSRKIEQAIADFEQRQMRDAQRELNAALAQISEKYNIAPSLLVEAGSSLARKPRKPSSKVYQNPNDSWQTWNGRGRKPGWVIAFIKAGGDIESLLVS